MFQRGCPGSSCMTLLRKSEERFLDECRDYAHVNVISRLKITRGREEETPVQGAT